MAALTALQTPCSPFPTRTIPAMHTTEIRAWQSCLPRNAGNKKFALRLSQREQDQSSRKA
jgi:hypothetical protein